MKVIFLDIDGVLNCARTPNPRNLPYVIDARLKKRLDRMLQRTGAKIVLASTWRYDPAALFTLKRHGIRLIDVTPDLPRRPRRDEVLAWLKKADRVTRYVVIDDEDDELDGLPLFQPSSRTGLSQRIVNGVVNYLDGKTDRDMRRPLLTRVIQNLRAAVTGHEG
jgi:HAD domain in Swiss Army Knife RNA repair proteins